MIQRAAPERRIYPLDPRRLSEEQIAVAFAMTSRSPDPFDVIAQRVTEQSAADFHERWVLNYGHASVAEHAVLHMAVENVSRLVCDEIEDNRLGSYTEKSSRYQVIEPGSYHVPRELEDSPLSETYVAACDRLFEAYERITEGLRAYLPSEVPSRPNESERAYAMRLRRVATDSARFLLPVATLSNVGFTINARGMEHAVRKLLSSDLAEAQDTGKELRDAGLRVTPTLIKYAEFNDYLAATVKTQREMSGATSLPAVWTHTPARNKTPNGLEAVLVHSDPLAEEKLVTAVLYRFCDEPYDAVWQHVQQMNRAEREKVVDEALARMSPHDVPIRETESVYYTFDLLMDYGAYREFKRHRMQSYVPQPLTVSNGYVTPPLVEQAGQSEEFHDAIGAAEDAYSTVAEESPRAAEYLVTHAHKRRVMTTMNLRECYHLFKLRTQPSAHFTLREVVGKAMELAQSQHPLLFDYLRLRS